MLDLLIRPWVASCHETGERLSDYVDGELEGRSLARVRRHLARCERCHALLESLTRTIEQLRRLGHAEPQPSADVVATVIGRIRRGDP